MKTVLCSRLKTETETWMSGKLNIRLEGKL